MSSPDTPFPGRLAVVAAWLAAGALLVPRAAGLEHKLDVGVRVSGSESDSVAADLAGRFASPFAEFAILVVRNADDSARPARQQIPDSLLARLRAVEGVTGVRAWRGPADSLLISGDRRTRLVMVGIDPSRGPDSTISRLRAVTGSLAGATMRWTGQAALNVDLRRVSAADARTAEQRVLPLSLVLLLLAFRTLVAAALPVLAGAVTIAMASGAAALLATQWSLSIMLQNVVSMIGLGLGIDYALLAVSRFRESLAAGRSAREAAADTARSAGQTVALSGLAVAVGFAGLLVVPVSELRSVGVGGLVTVSVSVLVATTLVPVLLAWLGPRVNRLGVLNRRSAVANGSERWRRWGRWVALHPVRMLLLAGIPVVALAWQSRRLAIGEPDGDWLPREMESALAIRDLEQAGRGGMLQTLRVVLEFPPDADAGSEAGWEAARRLHRHLAADPSVALVSSMTHPEAREIPRALFLSLPDSLQRMLVAADHRAALFDVVPREGTGTNALISLVRAIRSVDAPAVSGLAGTSVRAGGLPAFRADYLDSLGDALPLVVVAIVVGTVLALAAGFRSVLVPLKAVALNLLSVAAGFGALVLVFQDGHDLGLFGPGSHVDRVFIAIPALVFCAVFGLSMDYEVFLVGRVAEARRGGLGEEDAIAEGLARTGPVITSAAAIMVVVFGAFALGEFLMMRMLGLALAVTVFVDAAVVRTVLGPALLSLAGRWNWWPGFGAGAAARPEVAA